MKIKPDNELTIVEKELLDKAREIGNELMSIIDERGVNFINDMLVKHNGLDQVLVYTFFGTILHTVFCKGIVGMKIVADQIGDNDCSTEQFFNEIVAASRIFLKFPDHDIARKGIKRSV